MKWEGWGSNEHPEPRLQGGGRCGRQRLVSEVPVNTSSGDGTQAGVVRAVEGRGWAVGSCSGAVTEPIAQWLAQPSVGGGVGLVHAVQFRHTSGTLSLNGRGQM
ncbi:hypothetical protein PLESTB_000006400 [Pleodorina starrii]|uniref:Uncharacterized protein n=1 Tax=Pleodorina starrii TaxID=330485 RepID=A0A9W6B815_9CHLO|nr:hypothetical protein PLESTM_000840800 [Pleodorina starrii]GLC47606.1 hypothetical protein PLESTB_000006400 [Pleodorina starrii]GLC75614.1 hypothetical protein PLESTF_001665400 [Pleodorina starrii]